jgi:hypothetical protein
MKAWIFSDLYLELGGVSSSLSIPAADICICAGNVMTGGLVLQFHLLPNRDSYSSLRR